MSEEKKMDDTTVDEDARIELRGTDPRVFLPRIGADGKPAGRQPILPKDREAAKNAVTNHS